MSTKRDAESSDDPRVAEAVALWKKAPMLNVGQVMRAACFTEADSKNKNKRMWITREERRHSRICIQESLYCI